MANLTSIKAASGRLLVVAMLVSLGLIALWANRDLRRISSQRFLVTIGTRPESGRKLITGREVVISVLGRRAADPTLTARAFLLAGDGQVLAGPAPLTVQRDERGRPREEAILPPLQGVPQGGMVAALVVRLPVTAAAAMKDVEAAVRGGQGDLQRLLSAALTAAQARGGHAEMMTAEVRPAPQAG